MIITINNQITAIEIFFSKKEKKLQKNLHKSKTY